MAAAKAWVIAQELDKSFATSIVKGNYVAYHCRLRRSRKSEKLVPDPTKRRSVKGKPVYNCQAQFTLNLTKLCQCDTVDDNSECNNYHETFRLRGCLTHSHTIEPQYLRLSKVKRNTLLSLLKKGVAKSTILKQYCSLYPAEDADYKLITAIDLENLQRQLMRDKSNAGPGQEINESAQAAVEDQSSEPPSHRDDALEHLEQPESRRLQAISSLDQWKAFLEMDKPWSEKRALIEKNEDLGQCLSLSRYGNIIPHGNERTNSLHS
ncbi:uncharacterized protein LOC131888178 isoform X2 [Tigriopus californicus]|nr:uncharacterized protein LOC131888178 isoform X2 [Tigriopus californicus]XP_059092952.1 uncharacterized protein LOC131888178 isoform X2 [Tigriopus californicus]XP_059092953.1 uncharacterized protein LOC131888178 isoform X2 [Tigriopus californicus]